MTGGLSATAIFRWFGLVQGSERDIRPLSIAARPRSKHQRHLVAILKRIRSAPQKASSNHSDLTHPIGLPSPDSYNTLGKTSDKVNSMRCTASAIWRLAPIESRWIAPSCSKISTCKALRMWWLHSATIRKR